jgi:exonuclease VII small subunit
MGSSWKLVLVFAVLFLTGGLSGSIITYSVLRRQTLPNPTRSFHSWTENLMQKVQRIARLTPEQSAKIRPRVEAAVKQMQSIQVQAMQQGSDALDAALAEIEPELNPDQQKRLERFRERRRQFLQEAITRRDSQQ